MVRSMTPFRRLAWLLVAVSSVVMVTELPSFAQSPIKIGVVLPLTGETAWGGVPAMYAARMAVEEINAAGGINGRPLQLVVADGECRPQAAYAAAQRLVVQERVDILMGEWCSSASIAMTQVAAEYGVPYLVQISTADAIAADGGKYVFQSIFQNGDIQEREAQLLLETFDFETVAILVENNDFGLTFRTNMIRQLEAAGKRVVVDIRQDRADTNLFPALTRIRTANPDLVVINLALNQAVNFVKTYVEAGLRIPVFSSYPPAPYIFEREVGEEAALVGLVRSAIFLKNGPLTEAQSRFVERFEAYVKGQTGQDHNTVHWDIVSYDGIYLIADALRRGGVEPDSFLQAMAETDYQGVLGRYRFDENRHVDPTGLPVIFIKNLPGGRLEVVATSTK